jgi:hypothetical protein
MAAMTAQQWNEKFEEHRMFYINSQPDTAPCLEPAYRQFEADLVISNEEDPRILYINRVNLLEGKWDKGEDVTDAYTIVDRLSLQSKAFPTSLETLNYDSTN